MRSVKKTLLFIVVPLALLVLLLAGVNLHQKNYKDTERRVYTSLEDSMRDPLVTNASEGEVLFEGSVPVDGYLIGLFRDQETNCLRFFSAESLSTGYRLHTISIPIRDLPPDQPLRGVFSFETAQEDYKLHHLVSDQESTTDELSERIVLSDGRFMHYQIEIVAH